ncbi:MAG TPA: hypothetical protein VF665_17595 [Longimicrobium sp.]|uniref:hypothetical protein n=1 Tax=Longimicrobium sp. TaxID=2029185 RepID=UPI002ED9E756
MTTRYQPAILQQHADMLYERADGLAFSLALKSAFSTGLIFALAGVGFGYLVEISPWGCSITGALAGGFMGFALGREMGEQQVFRLRLEAQELLCRLMTEKNTADMLRIASRTDQGPAVQLDAATLKLLRPGRSMRSRMSRLGE